LLHRIIGGEQGGSSPQRQRPQVDLPGAPAVQRRPVFEQFSLHHADVRPAQDQHEPGVLQSLIPDLLQN